MFQQITLFVVRGNVNNNNDNNNNNNNEITFNGWSIDLFEPFTK